MTPEPALDHAPPRGRVPHRREKAQARGLDRDSSAALCSLSGGQTLWSSWAYSQVVDAATPREAAGQAQRRWAELAVRLRSLRARPGRDRIAAADAEASASDRLQVAEDRLAKARERSAVAHDRAMAMHERLAEAASGTETEHHWAAAARHRTAAAADRSA